MLKASKGLEEYPLLPSGFTKIVGGRMTTYFVFSCNIPTFVAMKKNIEIHLVDLSTTLPLPYADEGIRAGFPSPAQDYMEQAIDLNKELIKHPSSTFYGRVVGDSMKDEGIEEGDILVIDKSLELIEGDLAVCYVDGEFTVKRVSIEGDTVWLVPSNPAYPKIKVTAEMTKPKWLSVYIRSLNHW